MITQSDIKQILFQDFSALGMEIYTKENVPSGKITDERVVIVVGKTIPNTIWESTDVNINIAIPDLDERGLANEIRIGEIQGELRRYDTVCGVHDETSYLYEKKYEEVKMGDFCHYIDFCVNFQTLNTIKK